MSPERSKPERRETAEETLQRFINFTQHPFGDEVNEEFGVAAIWEHHMDKLYGNEERMRLNKDESLRGVRGIQERLQQALVRGGMPALKIEFLNQMFAHAKISTMGENAFPAIARIVNFK